MARRHPCCIHGALFPLLVFALIATLWGILPSLITVSFQGASELLSDAPSGTYTAPRKTRNTNTINVTNRTMQFIPSNNLGKLDYFSATWI
jgi:hypothetical protein